MYLLVVTKSGSQRVDKDQLCLLTMCRLGYGIVEAAIISSYTTNPVTKIRNNANNLGT